MSVYSYGWFQLLRMFVSQQFNGIEITWYLFCCSSLGNFVRGWNASCYEGPRWILNKWEWFCCSDRSGVHCTSREFVPFNCELFSLIHQFFVTKKGFVCWNIHFSCTYIHSNPPVLFFCIFWMDLFFTFIIHRVI